MAIVPTTIFYGSGGCDTPSPSGAAVLLLSAVFARSRNRKA
jgi:hypothetical protein